MIFLKGEMKIFNGDVLNFDDLFGDDEDYEKFVVLVKSFEEKYVS